MIQATIRNKDKSTAVLDLPMGKYELASALESIGIRMSTRDIRAGVERNGISVQYSADNDLGHHLLAIFPDDICLDDVQHTASMVENAHQAIREKLEQHILQDQCGAIRDLPDDIRQMLVDASIAHETYYFPLTGRQWDEEYGSEIEISAWSLYASEDKIRERFEEYLDGDNMAAYYTEAGAEKLLLTDWGFAEFDDELYGSVSVYLTEPMTEEEEASLKKWIRGQNSDGLGEGFEQQPIELDEGELYVSFWHDGDDYYIKSKNEMDEYLGMASPQMGGM